MAPQLHPLPVPLAAAMVPLQPHTLDLTHSRIRKARCS